MSLDRDLKRKEQAKYDDRFVEMETEASDWLERVLGAPLPPAQNSTVDDLCARLKDGVALCQLCNAIRPGSTKVRRSAMPFVQMEQIAHFLTFARDVVGVPTHDLFQTVDLFERKNVFQVVQTIHVFSRFAAQKKLVDVPHLGPRMSTSVSRDFSKEQLHEARNTVNTFQYGKATGSTNVLRSSRRDPTGNIY